MNKRYSFQDLIEIIEQRISSINYEPEKYSLKSESLELTDNRKRQTVDVLYDNVKIICFRYYISRTINESGSNTCSTMITLKEYNDSEWYAGKLQYVNVNEFLQCSEANVENDSLENVLDQILPLSDIEKESQIETQLKSEGFENFDVKFDTKHDRYIVLGDLGEILELSETKGRENENDYLFLYKYMTLDTYFKMLINKTFRMNSIVSMNDESESFLLGDELCNIYTGSGVEEKYMNTLENSRTLISSFTDQYDSALMWRLYGDSGKGICVGFCIYKKKVTKIHYLSESEAEYVKLKKCVDNLKRNYINIYFKDIDSFKHYAKSDGFKYEDEYRLSITCDEKDLSWAKYGNLISPYRDFPINMSHCESINIGISGILIGAKLPNFEVNYPLLVDLTNRHLKVKNINLSKENKFRE